MATRVSALPHHFICCNSHFLLWLRAFVLVMLSWSLPTTLDSQASPYWPPFPHFAVQMASSQKALLWTISEGTFPYSIWMFLNIWIFLLSPPSSVSLLHLLPSFLWCWGQSSGTYMSWTLLLSYVSSIALSSVLNASWELFLHLWRLLLSLSL